MRNRVAAGRDASFLWTLLKSEFLLINTAQGAFYLEWMPVSWAFPAHMAPPWAGLGWVSPGLAENSWGYPWALATRHLNPWPRPQSPSEEPGRATQPSRVPAPYFAVAAFSNWGSTSVTNSWEVHGERWC